MSSSNETSNADLKNSKTGWSLTILIGIGLVIVGFYFVNFNSQILKNEDWWNVFQNLSKNTGNWGTFGDYVGGILNPFIAAFAFYLIRETYKLQRTELKETRKLLKVSTDAQNDQVKLAALTALLNSNLTRISLLKSEKTEVWNEIPIKRRPQSTDSRSIGDLTQFDGGLEPVLSEEDNPKVRRFREINGEIKSLTDNNNELEKQIKDIFKMNLCNTDL